MKKVLSVLLAILMAFAALPLSAMAATGIGNPTVNNGTATWDCVWFGTYRQTIKNGAPADLESSYTVQPVKWRVLNVKNNKALLLADTILDAEKFNQQELQSVDFENADIDEYFNNYMIKHLFTDEEQKALVSGADDSRMTAAGLLSLASESIMRNTSYGFVSSKDSAFARSALSTDFVKSYLGYTDYFYWLWDTWNYKASVVTGTGEIKTQYYNNDNYFGIRPVVVLDLSKNVWKKAGTVTGEGTVNEIAPDAKDKNTLTAKGKTVTVKYRSLKKKTQTIVRKKALTVAKAKGTVTYKKKSGNKKITINKKTGKITVKKGLKKGTYKVKIQVTAAGNSNYEAAVKTVTVTIKVK